MDISTRKGLIERKNSPSGVLKKIKKDRRMSKTVQRDANQKESNIHVSSHLEKEHEIAKELTVVQQECDALVGPRRQLTRERIHRTALLIDSISYLVPPPPPPSDGGSSLLGTKNASSLLRGRKLFSQQEEERSGGGDPARLRISNAVFKALNAQKQLLVHEAYWASAEGVELLSQWGAAQQLSNLRHEFIQLQKQVADALELNCRLVKEKSAAVRREWVEQLTASEKNRSKANEEKVVVVATRELFKDNEELKRALHKEQKRQEELSEKKIRLGTLLERRRWFFERFQAEKKHEEACAREALSMLASRRKITF